MYIPRAVSTEGESDVILELGRRVVVIWATVVKSKGNSRTEVRRGLKTLEWDAPFQS